MKLIMISPSLGTTASRRDSSSGGTENICSRISIEDGIAIVGNGHPEDDAFGEKLSKVIESVKDMPDNMIVVSIEKDKLTSYLGGEDVKVMSTPQGILITNSSGVDIKRHTSSEAKDYERRLWGEYHVIDRTDCGNGLKSLTKHLSIDAGKSISYQLHKYRSEIWTIVRGQGLLILDGQVIKVGVGQTINIGLRQLHTIKALSDLDIIEVQMGTELREDDIERFNWNWENI